MSRQASSGNSAPCHHHDHEDQQCPSGHVHSPFATAHLSSIWEAAREGDAARLESILSHGNCDVRDDSGYTALHYAARNGRLSACELLLRKGADANAQTGAQRATPLIRAAYCGHYEIVKLLLERGKASIDLVDVDARTPLSHAAQLVRCAAEVEESSLVVLQQGQWGVAEFLLQKGASIDSADRHGRTPRDMMRERKDLPVSLADIAMTRR